MRVLKMVLLGGALVALGATAGFAIALLRPRHYLPGWDPASSQPGPRTGIL